MLVKTLWAGRMVWQGDQPVAAAGENPTGVEDGEEER